MLSITYLSSAVRLFSDAELVDLLVDARERNARVGISGMMLYSGGNIIQVLEGPDDAVLATYGCIAADRRHHGLIQMLADPISERAFPGWSMGFRSVDKELASVPGYADPSKAPAVSERGTNARSVDILLNTFRRATR